MMRDKGAYKIHVVHQGNEKSIQNCSTVTSLTMDPYRILQPLLLPWGTMFVLQTPY